MIWIRGVMHCGEEYVVRRTTEKRKDKEKRSCDYLNLKLLKATSFRLTLLCALPFIWSGLHKFQMLMPPLCLLLNRTISTASCFTFTSVCFIGALKDIIT